jgi:putative tryptophan/tyrosine transport system substrate-binding protein
MRRREFIGGLAGTAAWPLVARAQAQQGERMRRIGVLMSYNETDPEAMAEMSGFTKGLAECCWTDGRNVRMDVRWPAANVDRMRMFAKELVGLQPDVILATSTPTTASLQRETRTIPIVFAIVADPVGEGFVASLPRPGGNITGFMLMEASMSGKWLEFLMVIAPGVKRVATMFNPDTSPGGGSFYLPAFEAAARSLKVEPITAPVHSDAEIETVITALGREPGGGLVVMPDAFVFVHRAPIILAAAGLHHGRLRGLRRFLRGLTRLKLRHLFGCQVLRLCVDHFGRRAVQYPAPLQRHAPAPVSASSTLTVHYRGA